MLHDVTLRIFDASSGVSRHEVIQVNAVTGDEAVAAGQLAGAAKVGHVNFTIIGIAPAEARAEPAPAAAVEGEDALPGQPDVLARPVARHR